jgi:hypothetical protein
MYEKNTGRKSRETVSLNVKIGRWVINHPPNGGISLRNAHCFITVFSVVSRKRQGRARQVLPVTSSSAESGTTLVILLIYTGTSQR